MGLQAYFNLLKNRYIFILAISILSALPFLIFSPFVKTIDNVDYFTLENDSEVDFYNNFKKQFNDDEFFVIALKFDAIFTKTNLIRLKKITLALETKLDAKEVKSLANVNDSIGEGDAFYVREFLETIPETEEGITKLRQEAFKNRLFKNILFSGSGEIAAIIVKIHEKSKTPEYRKKIIKNTKGILKEHNFNENSYHIGGWTTTNLGLSSYMKKDVSIFIPVTYILITIAIFLFFRNRFITMAAILNVSLCLCSLMGLFVISKITLNNVTSIVSPLIMALALCDTVHIFSHMDREFFDKYPCKKEAFIQIIRLVIFPCFLTTITTFAGFLSLGLSDIPPIKDFSFIASVGIIFEFFFAFTFLPSFVLLLGPEKFTFNRKSSEKFNRILKRTGEIAFHRYLILFCSGVFLIILSAISIPFIKVDTNLIGYFKKSSKIYMDTKFIENNLSGVNTFDISLKSDEMNFFKNPNPLLVIEKIKDFIEENKEVDTIVSVTDFIKDMNESFNGEDRSYYRIPKSRQIISQLLFIFDFEEIENFIDPDFTHARISVRISEHSTKKQKQLIDKVQTFINDFDTQGMDIKITGRVVKDIRIVDALVQGQIKSLLTAIAVISIILFFSMGSFYLALISIIPNIFPIVLNFGLMRVFNIPLNEATALISAVAIGIAVDDTIHFMNEYSLLRKGDKGLKESIQITILNKGRAIILSSLILSTGFAALLFSNFIPSIYFGALSCMIMLTAIIGDLFFLPSILILFKKIRLVSSP